MITLALMQRKFGKSYKTT